MPSPVHGLADWPAPSKADFVKAARRQESPTPGEQIKSKTKVQWQIPLPLLVFHIMPFLNMKRGQIKKDWPSPLVRSRSPVTQVGSLVAASSE